MNAMMNFVLPSPEPGEPSDVTVALEAARALWENGETDEALRWFSRAAEAAEQAGDDRRALDLARAVADLKDSLAAKAPAQPMAPAPDAAPAGQVAQPPAPKAMPAPPVMPVPPVRAQGAPVPSSIAPTAKSVTRPPPPPSSRKSLTPAPPSVQPAAAPSAPSAQPVATPSVRPVATPSVRPAAAPTPAKVAEPKQHADSNGKERLRVSVRSSVRDPNLLLVRVLGAGQAVPSGCHEAFLTPTESGIDLRSTRGE